MPRLRPSFSVFGGLVWLVICEQRLCVNISHVMFMFMSMFMFMFMFMTFITEQTLRKT